MGWQCLGIDEWQTAQAPRTGRVFADCAPVALAQETRLTPAMEPIRISSVFGLRQLPNLDKGNKITFLENIGWNLIPVNLYE